MAKVILLNKPFQVLCQFSPHENKDTLKTYIDQPNFYPCGRLDYDSEGLLVLSNDGALQALIAHPKHKMKKTYWAQVEGDINEEALVQLRKGVSLKDGVTKPAQARRIKEPTQLWERNPPIRERKNIPTSWIELTISEGKNRQVRRMTAAVGFPTLRLIRSSVGNWQINQLNPGDWCYGEIPDALLSKLSPALKKDPKSRFNKSHQKNKATTNGRGRRYQKP